MEEEEQVQVRKSKTVCQMEGEEQEKGREEKA